MTSRRGDSGLVKTALHVAVEENNVEQVSLLVRSHDCEDVNTRVIDLNQIRAAHDQLLSSVTPNQLHEISSIAIPYDVTVAIIFAVCLITCAEEDDHMQPTRTFLQVW